MNRLSFRDPLSKVCSEGSTVYRKLDNHSFNFFKTLKAQNFFQEMIKKRKYKILILMKEISL